MKSIFHRRIFPFIVFLITLLSAILPAASIYALDYPTLKFFSYNGIIYYDPSPRQKCSSALDCNISGNTHDEKLWSALRNIGFTPEQAAAVMSNILHEGGTPTRQEDAYNIARNRGCLTSNGTPYDIWSDSSTGQYHTSCMSQIYSGYRAGSGVAGVGIGFVGWTARSRRIEYLELMKDAGLIQYFEGDAYKTYGSYTDDQLRDAIVAETGSEADYWALWCTAIKYIFYEFSSPRGGMDWTKFFDITDVAEAAGYVAKSYEVCNGCQPGESSYNSRVAMAEEIYRRYQNGEFAAVEGGTAYSYDYDKGTLSNGSEVTIIGDSITVGSEAALKAVLPKADIIAQGSKLFSGTDSNNPTGQQIIENLQAENKLRSTVVVALGTNGSGLTTREIDTMVQTIGNDHNIIFVNNYDDKSPAKYDKNNELLDAAAVTYDNVSVANWKATVIAAEAASPSTTYIYDETNTDSAYKYAVHPTPEGQKLFAETITKAISTLSSSLDTCQDTTLISDPSQALSYLQQFIVDTNHRYGFNYTIPTSAPIDQALGTPGDDSATSTGECWGATYCGQCTALSGWFVTMMTNFNYGNGDGREVVDNLVATNGGKAYFAVLGEFPKGVAIFSTGGGTWGHTGVILGRDGDGNFITIENNVQKYQLAVRSRTEEYFKSQSGKFFLIDTVKTEHLGTTY